MRMVWPRESDAVLFPPDDPDDPMRGRMPAKMLRMSSRPGLFARYWLAV
jgi:hypothetical protein